MSILLASASTGPRCSEACVRRLLATVQSPPQPFYKPFSRDVQTRRSLPFNIVTRAATGSRRRNQILERPSQPITPPRNSGILVALRHLTLCSCSARITKNFLSLYSAPNLESLNIDRAAQSQSQLWTGFINRSQCFSLSSLYVIEWDERVTSWQQLLSCFPKLEKLTIILGTLTDEIFGLFTHPSSPAYAAVVCPNLRELYLANAMQCPLGPLVEMIEERVKMTIPGCEPLRVVSVDDCSPPFTDRRPDEETFREAEQKVRRLVEMVPTWKWHFSNYD
jgi:hypothetical protein